MIETLNCLSCGGHGKTFYICTMTHIECGSCKGTGKVERDAAWLEKGQRLRLWRIDHDLSLREFAKKVGVGVVALSAAEHGRADPEPFMEAMR